MSQCVQFDVEEHVAHVRLNRPEKHNAISLDLFAELALVGDRIAGDAAVRAVVLSGAGDNFCAGIDTSVFAELSAEVGAGAMAPSAPSPANLFQRAAYVWREVPVPVVCAIHGVAFGGGLQISLGSDIRYAAPDAKFSIMEIKWGLIPDMAISTTARDIIPADKLRELAYTGRVVAAPEALDVGLITAIHDDPLAAAMTLASEIASRSPDAIRAMKTLFNSGLDLTEADALALEAKLQLSVIGAKNQLEAVQANIEKRVPNFSD